MTNNIKQNIPTVILAIVAILFLESYALYKGINGIALTAAIGAITGLGGFKIGKYLQVRSSK